MLKQSIGFSLAAAGFAAVLGASAQGFAAPAVNLKSATDTNLVQNVDYVKRRWWRSNRYDTEVDAPTTWVRTNDAYTDVDAPFTSVRKSPQGTWVRAPFVNLFVPRR